MKAKFPPKSGGVPIELPVVGFLGCCLFLLGGGAFCLGLWDLGLCISESEPAGESEPSMTSSGISLRFRYDGVCKRSSSKIRKGVFDAVKEVCWPLFGANKG